MKSLRPKNKYSNFYLSLKENYFKIHKDIILKKKDSKYIPFDFKIKHFLIFDINGSLLINSSIAESIKLSDKFLNSMKLLVMKMICSDLKFLEIFFKNFKIFILNKNFLYVLILGNKCNTCLARLYLFFFNIVFINLLGENILNQTSVNLKTISKIVEVYYIPPITSKFCSIMEYILSKKEVNSSKYLYKFKNLFIYYIEPNGSIITLFDYRKINYCKELKYKYNIRKNYILFNYITQLVLEPIYNNNYLSESEIYSHSLELLATFPRWFILGKYLKVFNGINFVQIYSGKKLSRITKSYQEIQVKEQNNIKKYYKIISKHSFQLLKLFEFFMNSYFETISDFANKYCNPKNDLFYFDIDLLIVTNDLISIKVAEDSLINLVYQRLQLNRIKMGKNKNSILLEENNENSNSNSNSKSSGNVIRKDLKKINKDNSITIVDKINEEIPSNTNSDNSSISITSVSKTFLQIDTSDIFNEIKRKSIQLSSFDSNALMDGNSELSEIWNISCIKNPNANNNNFDLRSLISNIPGEKKFSGRESLSIFEKPDMINMSRRQTDKQINIFKGHRNSIGPTFNIIVNNNNNNDKLISKQSKDKNFINNNINNNISNNKNFSPSPNKKNYNYRKKFSNKRSSINSSFIKRVSLLKRSNSSTQSGLYLNQFYSIINNNPKFFKTKYQILKEIQNEIKQTASQNNKSLIVDKFQQKKKSAQISKKKIFEFHNNYNNNNIYAEDKNDEFKNDILQEYYEDKSSINFVENNDNSNNAIFRKLNEK